MKMEWIELALSVLAGLSAAIPLVVKLIEYVQKAIKEKNWRALLSALISYMEIAEEKFETGAQRKEWVLGMAKGFADTVGYEIDLAALDKLIDDLCSMSKVVNPPNE